MTHVPKILLLIPAPAPVSPRAPDGCLLLLRTAPAPVRYGLATPSAGLNLTEAPSRFVRTLILGAPDWLELVA